MVYLPLSPSNASRMGLETSLETGGHVVSLRDRLFCFLSGCPLHGTGGFSKLNPQGRKAASSGQRRASLVKIWGPFLLSVILAFLFMRSVCHQKFKSGLPGVQMRRLGESEHEEEGDVTRPTSPDLAELCFALGEWAPDSSSSGGLRASPSLVEALLAELDAEVESGDRAASNLYALGESDSSLGSFATRPGVKRLRSEEERGEGESLYPGPSWKVARTHSSTTVEETSYSMQSPHHGDWSIIATQAPPIPPQAQVPSYPQPSTSTTSLQQYAAISRPHHAAGLTGAASFSEGEPSTSSGPPLGLTASRTDAMVMSMKHPFLRLPLVDFSVEAVEFDVGAIRSATRVNSHYVAVLRQMRALFLEERLNGTDATRLMQLSLTLAEHTYHMQTAGVERVRPSHAAGTLGQRFMIYWSLFSASQILKQNWPQQAWWKDMSARVPTFYPLRLSIGYRPSPFHIDLCLQLGSAIEQLKRGIPLSEAVIFSLKQKLFCSKQSPYQFRNASWTPWRKDGQFPH